MIRGDFRLPGRDSNPGSESIDRSIFTLSMSSMKLRFDQVKRMIRGIEDDFDCPTRDFHPELGIDRSIFTLSMLSMKLRFDQVKRMIRGIEDDFDCPMRDFHPELGINRSIFIVSMLNMKERRVCSSIRIIRGINGDFRLS
jgi:hypothetical protein